jgi:hypothetical protein
MPKHGAMGKALPEIILGSVEMRIYMQHPNRPTQPLGQRAQQSQSDAMLAAKGKQVGQPCCLIFDHSQAFFDIPKRNIKFAKIRKIKPRGISARDRVPPIGQHACCCAYGARPITGTRPVCCANIKRHARHAKASAPIIRTRTKE